MPTIAPIANATGSHGSVNTCSMLWSACGICCPWSEANRSNPNASDTASSAAWITVTNRPNTSPTTFWIAESMSLPGSVKPVSMCVSGV
jgi:hypothetical protein